jgi:hypothetical protein
MTPDARARLAQIQLDKIAAVMSEFGFSDTDDVPLADVLRGGLQVNRMEFERMGRELEATQAELAHEREKHDEEAYNDAIAANEQLQARLTSLEQAHQRLTAERKALQMALEALVATADACYLCAEAPAIVYALKTLDQFSARPTGGE